MRILHLFPEYLPPTMVWAHTQLTHCPAVEIHIAGLTYLTEYFPKKDFIFWDNPKYNFPKCVQPAVHQLLSKTGQYEAALADYAARAAIDVLHLHFGHIGADYAALGTRLGIPVVVSFYGFDYQRVLFEKPRYIPKYQKMFQVAHAITCEGPYAASQLQAMGCPSSKIHLIPLGVDVSHIPYRLRQKYPNALRLAQVATITPHKGQLLSIQAFHQALQTIPDMHLTLYGPVRNPGYAQALYTYIHQHSLDHHIRICGSLPYPQLHQMLFDDQVFIHPSVHSKEGDREGGAPVVLLDAQATGMPVISTRHCDIPAVVKHRITGILCEEADQNGLCSAILEFARMDEQTYHTYAQQARSNIEASFSAVQTSQQLVALYEHTLA